MKGSWQVSLGWAQRAYLSLAQDRRAPAPLPQCHPKAQLWISLSSQMVCWGHLRPCESLPQASGNALVQRVLPSQALLQAPHAPLQGWCLKTPPRPSLGHRGSAVNPPDLGSLPLQGSCSFPLSQLSHTGRWTGCPDKSPHQQRHPKGPSGPDTPWQGPVPGAEGKVQEPP